MWFFYVSINVFFCAYLYTSTIYLELSLNLLNIPQKITWFSELADAEQSIVPIVAPVSVTTEKGPGAIKYPAVAVRVTKPKHDKKIFFRKWDFVDAFRIYSNKHCL